MLEAYTAVLSSPQLDGMKAPLAAARETIAAFALFRKNR
jgi:hypothetical protein